MKGERLGGGRLTALLLMGLASGLFFSSTFILNRVMSLAGGHWVWSAGLRYAYMILFLLVWTALFQGFRAPGRILRHFARHWKFWVAAGGIGFGGFYALLCFSADHAPGWVIATTWQVTILSSLVVLSGFGRSFPSRVWIFSLVVFFGVLLVNLSQAGPASVGELWRGALPVLAATFCYPIGNQMVWEATNGHRTLPDIRDPLLENPFNKVLLLSLGSVPFWAALVVVTRPPPPSAGQLLNTALVAVFSGILATSLFLRARTLARQASELAAVDATQSSEIVFAMLGEMLILDAPLPGGMAWAGILLIFAGLALFIGFQERR